MLSSASRVSREIGIRNLQATTLRFQAASAEGTAATLYRKLFGVKESEGFSRETIERYASEVRKPLAKLDPVEAYHSYCGLLLMADMYGLTKFPHDGGKVLSAEEFNQHVKKMPEENIHFCTTVVLRPQFRAIDTNKDGVISRGEWGDYLKIWSTFKNAEHAKASFDSLDENKDGVISLEEFVNAGIKFWIRAKTGNPPSDFFGINFDD